MAHISFEQIHMNRVLRPDIRFTELEIIFFTTFYVSQRKSVMDIPAPDEVSSVSTQHMSLVHCSCSFDLLPSSRISPSGSGMQLGHAPGTEVTVIRDMRDSSPGHPKEAGRGRWEITTIPSNFSHQFFKENQRRNNGTFVLYTDELLRTKNHFSPVILVIPKIFIGFGSFIKVIAV